MSDAVLYIPAGTPAAPSPLAHTWREPHRPRELRTVWHQPSTQTPENFALDRWGEFPEDEQFELADELGDAWAHVVGYRPSWTLQVRRRDVAARRFDRVHRYVEMA